MNYKGKELKDISSTPQIFDPSKKMLVWRDDDNEPCIDLIYAIGPSSMDFPVRAISDDGRLGTHCYKHCAEIPKPRRATNRELARWLTKGCGQVHYVSAANCHTFYSYQDGDDDSAVYADVKIRKWDDTDWHEPTVDYMGIE